jgi:Cytochrome C oxidase, cbb3-type, subunit III
VRVLKSLTISIALALPTVAAGQNTTISSSRFSGAADFQAYCASCHGPAAKGDGVIATSLVKRPPDLTRLAKRHDDVFPEERVFKMIDGRSPATSHRAPDMPAWGDVFAKAIESAGPEAAAARITALVRYLEMIQEKR